MKSPWLYANKFVANPQILEVSKLLKVNFLLPMIENKLWYI